MRALLFVTLVACGQTQDLGTSGPTAPTSTPTPSPAPQTCTPKTCANVTCGTVDDGCGGRLDCACPVVAVCANAKKDANESDVDCGGSSSCARCAVGKACTSQDDCDNARCVNDRCHVSSFREAQPMPTARGQLGVVAAKSGIVYAAGGMAKSGPSAALEAYDVGADEWTALKPMTTKRYGVCAVQGPDDRIYVIGGQYADNFTDGLSVRVESYSIATNTWRDEPSLLEGRYDPACVVAGGKIWVLGGFTVNPGATLASVETFTPGAAQWTAHAMAMTTGRTSHAATLGPDGLVYVFGGGDLSADAAMSQTAERMNPATGTFTTLPQMTRARGAAAVAAAFGRIVLFGGTQARTSSEAFDPTTKQWETLPDLPSSRRAAAGVALNDAVLVVGGYESDGFSEGPSRLVDIFVY